MTNRSRVCCATITPFGKRLVATKVAVFSAPSSRTKAFEGVLAERECDASRGLQPTDWNRTNTPRGARADRFDWSRSGAAPRRAHSSVLVRGLKPTATIDLSLRDSAPI